MMEPRAVEQAINAVNGVLAAAEMHLVADVEAYARRTRVPAVIKKHRGKRYLGVVLADDVPRRRLYANGAELRFGTCLLLPCVSARRMQQHGGVYQQSSRYRRHVKLPLAYAMRNGTFIAAPLLSGRVSALAESPDALPDALCE